MPADWAHVYLSVLHPLPLICPQEGEAARVAAALKSAAAAAVARYAMLHLLTDTMCSHCVKSDSHI